MNSKPCTVLEDFILGAKGSRTVHAFAALAPGQPLQPWEYEPEPLGTGEVEIAVTHCGVCHTDLHLIDNQLGAETYPLVPGHEVIGTIAAVGATTGDLAIGRRVGVGFQRGACNQCEWCQKGLQHLCAGLRPTALARYGGFAQRLRADHQFAIPIPDSLDSAVAAPCFAREFRSMHR